MISVKQKRGCLNDEKWCISHFGLTTDIGQDNVRPVRPPTDFCDEREIPMKFSPIQSITFSQLFLRANTMPKSYYTIRVIHNYFIILRIRYMKSLCSPRNQQIHKIGGLLKFPLF